MAKQGPIKVDGVVTETLPNANFKVKLDNAVKNMENLIIPKDVVEMERVSIPQYSTLDPLPWIQLLQTYFILAEGVPEVIVSRAPKGTGARSLNAVCSDMFSEILRKPSKFADAANRISISPAMAEDLIDLYQLEE